MITIINGFCENFIHTMTMQKMYDFLTDENMIVAEDEINEKTVTNIIAWLPNLKEMIVHRYMSNSYIDIIFTNTQRIKLYNVGIEHALFLLVQ